AFSVVRKFTGRGFECATEAHSLTTTAKVRLTLLLQPSPALEHRVDQLSPLRANVGNCDHPDRFPGDLGDLRAHCSRELANLGVAPTLFRTDEACGVARHHVGSPLTEEFTDEAAN